MLHFKSIHHATLLQEFGFSVDVLTDLLTTPSLSLQSERTKRNQIQKLISILNTLTAKM